MFHSFVLEDAELQFKTAANIDGVAVPWRTGPKPLGLVGLRRTCSVRGPSLHLQHGLSRLFCDFAHSHEFPGAVLGEEADDILL
jgi:hypothetical protein